MKTLFKSIHLFILFLYFSLFLISSASANGDGLLNIYNKALKKDPLLAAAQYAANAGNEKQAQSLSQLLPQVSLSAGFNYGRTHRTGGINSDVTADGRDIGAKLSQPLVNISKYKAYLQSKQGSDIYDIQLDQARQDLILRVAQSYFDVLSASESLAVAKSQTKSLNENLERAKLTFKVGTATKTDKLEAQARFDLARSEEISSINLLAISNQMLASIIGEPPGKLKNLSANAKLLNFSSDGIQFWVDNSLANNLQLKLITTNYSLAKKEVGKLKSDRLPTLDFSVDGSNSKNTFFGPETTTTSFSMGLNLKMPIYTGGLMSSRIREAEYLRLELQQKTINSRRQAVLETQRAYLTAFNGQQQVEALKQALKSSQSALEATRKGVEVGVRTNLDLLNSQQQFFSTQRDYLVAKYNHMLNGLKLKAAAGMLSISDIRTMDTLLN